MSNAERNLLVTMAIAIGALCKVGSLPSLAKTLDKRVDDLVAEVAKSSDL